MRKAILALGLLGGLATSQAAVVTLTAPGDNEVLSTVAGIGIGVVFWTSPTAVAVGVINIPAVNLGYVVDNGTGLIVAQLNPGSPTPTFAFLDVPVGVPAPIKDDGVTEYYLIAGNDTGGAAPGVGGPVTDLDYVAVKTDSFVLVPEPGTYALLAGLGLVGFAGYRRFRG